MVGGALYFVLTSPLLWLLTAKILKGGTGLIKAFELAGLTAMISAAGGLATMTLVLLKGDIQAGFNLGLLLQRFDPASYSHQILAMCNGFTIWYLAILSLGVSKLTGRPFGAAGIWVFGFWAIVGGGLALGGAWWARVQAGL